MKQVLIVVDLLGLAAAAAAILVGPRLLGLAVGALFLIHLAKDLDR